jgi:hypothetical protein
MNSWWNLKSVILADDMGLGKTVQIAAFLGLLGSDAWHTYPMLVVVPNSTLQSQSSLRKSPITIANSTFIDWLREFAKWVPHLRVVPLQGSKASRDIIRKYEMFTPSGDLKWLAVNAELDWFVLTLAVAVMSSWLRTRSSFPRKTSQSYQIKSRDGRFWLLSKWNPSAMGNATDGYPCISEASRRKLVLSKSGLDLV